MNRKSFFFVLLFLMIMSSVNVFAFSVDIDSSSSDVEISGSCTSASEVLMQISLDGVILFISEAKVDSSDAFLLDYFAPRDGTYSLASSCDGEVISSTFCVGSSCATDDTSEGDVEDSSDEGGDGSDDDSGSGDSGSSEDSSSSGSSRGSSFYSSCNPSWKCDSWTSCSSDLTQSRSCTDLNACGTDEGKPEETQSCSSCEERWICGGWSECSLGTQNRDCIDEGFCGTYNLRPDESRSCSDSSSSLDYSSGSFSGSGSSSSGGSVSTTVLDSVPVAASRETVYIQEQTFMDPIFSFLQTNWLIILIILIVLILLIFLLIFLLRYKDEHAPAANLDELHEFVRLETEAGRDQDQIRTSLLNSGWSPQEIEGAFSLV